MSGGGGTTTQVQRADPWSAAQPYLRDIMSRGMQYADNPAAFYPGATFLGPTAGQLAGWDTQLNYADQVYGGATAPKFGEATAAVSGALTGQNTLGGYSQSLSPFANSQIQLGFAGGAPSFNPSAFTPQQQFNPAQFTPQTSFNPSQFSPGVQFSPSQFTPQTQFNPSAFTPTDATFNPSQFTPQTQFNPSAFTPQTSFSPSQFTPQTQFNPSQFNPNLQTAGGMDTTNAFSRALSGQPDFGGLQASINAANAPILRQFEQDILPGLNQRASFLGNPTGGIKTLNRVLPEIGERMAMNAATITEGERNRALQAQQGAAQYLTGAGLQGAALGQQGAQTAAQLQLQGAGLGLQGAQAAGQLGLQSQALGQQGAQTAAQLGLQSQALGQQGAQTAAQLALQRATVGQQGAQTAAQLGLQSQALGQQGGQTAAQIALQNAALGQQGAQTAAQLGLQGYGLGLQGAQTAGQLGLQGYGLGLQGAQSAANVQSDYRNQLLGLGGLGAQLAGAQSDAALRASSLFPSLVQAGSVPGQLSSQFADWTTGFQQRALDDQIARFNYYQQLPLAATQAYSGLVSGMGGMGGTTTAQMPGGSGAAGAAGGALAGAQLGASFGPWGALIGAVGGGLLGGYA